MKRFSPSDLVLIKDNAIKNFIALPGRCRLPGMLRDLDEDEKRTIAYVQACVSHLSRHGAIAPGAFDELTPKPYTEVQEVVEGQDYSVASAK
jgi:hypothetical protein